MNVNPDSGEHLFDAALDVLSNADNTTVVGAWTTVTIPTDAWARLTASASRIIKENTRPGRGMASTPLTGRRAVPLVELERRLVAKGYDLDELEIDNPYNQWQQEHAA